MRWERRREPEPRVVAWFEQRPAAQLYLSVLTLGEIRRGVERLTAGERQQALRTWLEAELPAFFSGRLLPIDDAIAQRWGHLKAEMGRPLPAIDSLLAATALEHNLVLVTRNLKDVADLPVAESAYRLSVRAQDAGLDEAARTKRKRLDSWLDEQVRAQPAGGRRRERVDFLREAEQQDAYTLLNRLVILQLMEEPGPSDQPLRKPALIKGGWNSRAYQDFRDLSRGVVRDDPTEGFGFLLQLVCEELETCWSDDMMLGWVYQYWNDPEPERLDTKINDGGKIEPHEIASKTQMFTERYMVDWMLQNSLGLMCIDYSRGT
jgi:predicted nucleic acid-binding protein